MKDIFKEELDIHFDYDLNCGTSDLFILKDKITEFLETLNSNHVIVYGDINLAAALAAKQTKANSFISRLACVHLIPV